MKELLPNELVLQVFSQLGKAECKAVRLVCRDWSALAAGLVHDRIHVSPQDENLQRFTAIAEHPVFSRTVNKLRFDARLYEHDLSEQDYLQCLLRQIRLQLCTTCSHQLLQRTSDDGRKIIQHATEPLPLYTKKLVDKERHLAHTPMIQKGYATYIKRASEQRRWLQSPLFWPALAEKLRRMVNIRDVEFDDSEAPYQPDVWDGFNNTPDTYLLHLQPGSLCRNVYSLQLTDFFHALQRSHLAIDSFSLCVGTFIRSLHPRHQAQPKPLAAFDNIREFSLYYGPQFKPGAMPAFRELVGSMRNLKHLKLYLACSDGCNIAWPWSVQELLSRSPAIWPQLSQLSLYGGFTHADEIPVLFRQQPALQRIILEDAQLTDGAHGTADAPFAEFLRLTPSPDEKYWTGNGRNITLASGTVDRSAILQDTFGDVR